MNHQTTIQKIEEKAHLMRKLAIDMALQSAKKGVACHMGPAFSIMEIVAALYFQVMKHDPANPGWEERDRFFLSKGHAILGYYPALALAGYFSTREMECYDPDHSELAGHPRMNLAYGIEASSGSLGHGLPLAVGYCLAAKMDQKKFSTYCLMGDGECNEGSVWEAMMFASHHHLDNLVAIVDRNRLQATGTCKDILDLGDLAAKWRMFDWAVREIDGHDVGQILQALEPASRPSGQPYAIIAHTLKGKGVSLFEDSIKWHHATLTPEEARLAYQELGFDGDEVEKKCS